MDRTGRRSEPSLSAERLSLEYDPDSRVYRVPFSPSGPATVGEVVVATVAAIEGVDSTALPPVHDVVDPEAVDRLLASAGGGPPRDSVVVEFHYAGYRVTVLPGEVRVGPSGGRVD